MLSESQITSNLNCSCHDPLVMRKQTADLENYHDNAYLKALVLVATSAVHSFLHHPVFYRALCHRVRMGLGGGGEYMCETEEGGGGWVVAQCIICGRNVLAHNGSNCL